MFNGCSAEIDDQYLRKGSQIYVEGNILTRKWQDQRTGQDRYNTKISVVQMQIVRYFFANHVKGIIVTTKKLDLESIVTPARRVLEGDSVNDQCR